MRVTSLLAHVQLLVVASPAIAQFSDQRVITTEAIDPYCVFAADLDGDGVMDVISASHGDNKIAWYKNLGSGVFEQQSIISHSATSARSVYAADLDGDNDIDVLAAYDKNVAWYRNNGSGGFGSTQVITTDAISSESVYAADLDGDSDLDVLSASTSDDKLAWYENDGTGSFGPQVVISQAAVDPYSVHAADVDGDGDLDVLSASFADDKIAWYENDGSGVFGPQAVISTAADGARSVHSVDLDLDGDIDVLSASVHDQKIAWYENDGSGAFGPQQVISTEASIAYSVYSADLDGDQDPDVLSASKGDSKIAWYRNTGAGSFGQQIVISQSAKLPYSVHAADLSGDGHLDVLSASVSDDKVAWYERLMGPLWFQSPVNGHWYRLLDPMTWAEAEAQAQALGGHLATVRNAAESDWIAQSFPGTGTAIWIGYTDQDSEGTFEWISGEPVGYENWRSGEPDDFLDADWAVLDPASGLWRDEPDIQPRAAAVEVIGDDCNFNQVPDTSEIAEDQAMDWNGDGVLDECAAPNYCEAEPNSTGTPAAIGASGTPVASDNNFTLEAWDLPLDEFAYFLASESTAFIPGFGGSSGNLCLGPPIIRFNNPNFGGKVLNSGSTGTVSFTLDLNDLPQGITFDPGETWFFQLWYRDFTTLPTSNTTDGIEVMFR